MTHLFQPSSRRWWPRTLAVLTLAATCAGAQNQPTATPQIRATAQPNASAQPSAPAVFTRYIGAVPLEQLSRGAVGHGTVLYFTVNPSQPQLVVQLSREAGAQQAVARVYDTSSLQTPYVPVRVQGEGVLLPSGLKPAAVLRAQGGWWTRQAGPPNYNLDIDVAGQAYAIWGESYTKKYGPGGTAAKLLPGEMAVTIRVRPDAKGWPKWDERRLVPPLGSNGYIRYTYSERHCAAPKNLDYGLTPLWPFVAQTGAYEQPIGALRAPLGVDWHTGRLTHVAELVTARQQSCSYTIYSLAPIKSGVVNAADFESPFAFYNLAGAEADLPNLILRTEHFSAQDRFSLGLERRLGGSPIPRDFETVRYSWRTAPGDQLWDYKVEVLGFHPYTAKTPLAGGQVVVDAPGYSDFPNWVTEKSWPIVTFVADESARIRSSEGIYTYSPRQVGLAYAFGLLPEPDAGAFSTIDRGFRGEYRFTTNAPPRLYLSTVDGRIHLLGAEGGVWNINPYSKLRVETLGNGPYINHWRLDVHERRQSELARADNLVLLVTANQLSVSRTYVPPTAWQGMPPKNAAEWAAFRNLHATTKAAQAPDLQNWFDTQSGLNRVYNGVTVGELHGGPQGGLQFNIQVWSPMQPQGGLSLPVLDNLTPGRYTVTLRRGQWLAVPYAPATLSGTLKRSPAVLNQPSWLDLTLHNDGTAAWRGGASLHVGTLELAQWDHLQLASRAKQDLRVAWTPQSTGELPVTLVTTAGIAVPLGNLTVAPAPARLPSQQFIFSGVGGPYFTATVLLTLIGLALLASWLLWRTL